MRDSIVKAKGCDDETSQNARHLLNERSGVR